MEVLEKEKEKRKMLDASPERNKKSERFTLQNVSGGCALLENDKLFDQMNFNSRSNAT